MYLTRPFKSRYFKATVLLLSVLVSLSSVSAHAAGKTKHSHKYDTVIIHEVYVFNPHPVIALNGQVVHNHIAFNPQPIISVPKPRCDTQGSTIKQTVAIPIQKVQINYYND